MGEHPVPESGTYEIDPVASSVNFRTRSVFGLIPVRGSFRIARGRIDVAGPAVKSTVEVRIGAGTFDSGVRRRDEHVRSGDFLDVATHPEIAFVGEGVEVGPGGTVLKGELTVRGVTGPVDVTVDSVAVDGPRLTVLGRAVVDRYAFGVTAAKGMAGRRLTVRLDVRATRAPR
ncbi:YceI family protein [Streptomyces sp. NPDC058067]|uniref:YceI family protein n=1 Tax=Streptomyces sp. NPDC058067 TaxID=3346324 RepID=UPI0036E92687